MHSVLQLSPVGRCQPRWPSRPGTAAARLACTVGRRRSRSGAVVSPQLLPQTKLAFHAFLEDGKAFYLMLVLKLQQRFGPAGLPPGGCWIRPAAAALASHSSGSRLCVGRPGLSALSTEAALPCLCAGRCHASGGGCRPSQCPPR